MECFHPIRIRDPSPDHDGYINVPCQKCFACQSNKRREWEFRCKVELQHSVCSYTVTYTYDNEHLPATEKFFIDDPLTHPEPRFFFYHPFRIKDLQDYHKLLRKELSFRFFGVAEYGGKFGRPHFHVIYFFSYPVNKDPFERLVRKLWQHGIQITVDVTDDRCIGYTTKYCVKMYNHISPRSQLLTSRRPGIGTSFVSTSVTKYLHSLDSDCINYQDMSIRLPRIIRDRVFSQSEKDLHSLKLLSFSYQNDEKLSEFGDPDVLRCHQKEVFVKQCLKSIKNSKL